jgi:flagella basal body P-ring formation protein FlgA
MTNFFAKNLCASITLICAISFSTFSSPAACGQAAPASEPMQVVVVPKQDLEKGSTPTESSLEEKKIELRLAPVNAVSGVAEVVGRTLKRKKFKGSIIVIDDLARPGDKLD